MERDRAGDTAIFRALKNARSAPFIESMIKHRSGLNITERNKVRTLTNENIECNHVHIIIS